MGNKDSGLQIRSNGSLISGLPYRMLLSLVPLVDAVVIVGTGLAAHASYSGWVANDAQAYLTAVVVQALLVMIAFHFSGIYDFRVLPKLKRHLIKVVGVNLVVFATMLGIGYALKVTDEFSRVWGFLSLGAGTILMCLHRVAFYQIVRKFAQEGKVVRNIAIVGCGDQALRLIESMDAEKEPWNRLVGLFDDRLKRVGPSFEGHPVLGDVDDLIEYVRNNELDDIVITLPWNAENRITDIVQRLNELPVGVRLGADLAGYAFQKSEYGQLGAAPYLTVQKKPLAGWGGVVKRVEDKILASLLIAAFAPLMLVVAALIKLESKGPVIFKQQRYGFNNRVFEVYKFRSMYTDMSDARGGAQATREDPRITRVGRFIRRTSLDELPQLFNVFEGTMSLVGPRPHAVAHNEEYAQIIAGYFSRHRVKPGITGWAQVNGLRGETDTPEKMAARVRYDVYYIENWSVLFDLAILARTALVGFVNKNAY